MPTLELDFTGAPPQQGGGSDRIPPGRYALKVTEISQATSGNGNPMIRVSVDVASGPEAGKQLRDQFMVGVGKEGSKFGLQRFHAFLIALGAPMAQGKVKFNTDSLVGKVFEGQVGDKEMPAQGEFDARIVSEVRAYHKLGSGAVAPKTAAPAAAPAAAPKAAAAAAPKPKPAPAPVAVVEEEPEAEAEEVTLDDSEAADITDEVDDLFA